MKKILITTGACVFAIAVFAQSKTNQGIIAYEEVVKMDIQLEGDAANMAHMFPKERRSKKVLYFTPDVTLYEKGKAQEEETNIDTDEGSVMIKMMEPDNKLYTDIKAKTQIEQREFMTRMFLINKDIDFNKWKITGNQKTILDYPCQEAICEEDGKKVAVWFTSAIPIPSGPSNYSGLPGMVLAVDVDNGDRTISAKSIELTTVDESLFVKPKKGKKVSEEQFDEIVEAKMKESGQEGSGGHQVIIKIQE